jgi:hypothetical protein
MGTLRLSAEGTVNRGLSPAIWQAHGFIGGNFYDPSRVGFYFDDFANVGQWADGDTVGYGVVIDTGGSIASDTAVDLSEGEFGVLRMTTDATDTDAVGIQMCGNSGNLVKIDDASGENGVVAFECRVKAATITTGDMSFFCGLAESGAAATDGMISDSADTLADIDCIGFFVKETDGASIQRVFKRNSGTMDEEDTGDDIALSTWVKLGFVYDPNAHNNEKVKFYVDGAECTNFGDVRCDATDLADDTNFPAGEELAPIILAKWMATAGATDYFDVDWLAVGAGFTGGI